MNASCKPQLTESGIYPVSLSLIFYIISHDQFKPDIVIKLMFDCQGFRFPACMGRLFVNSCFHLNAFKNSQDADISILKILKLNYETEPNLLAGCILSGVAIASCSKSNNNTLNDTDRTHFI